MSRARSKLLAIGLLAAGSAGSAQTQATLPVLTRDGPSFEPAPRLPEQGLAIEGSPEPNRTDQANVEHWAAQTDVGEDTQELTTIPHFVMEGLPDREARSLRTRSQEIDRAGGLLVDAPAALIARGMRRWKPGQVVRVAFDGGSDTLRVGIEQTAQKWTGPDFANLTLSFRKEDGSFRTFTTQDQTYAAEIRISFEGVGYQSLVGAESTDYNLRGGRPDEPSMYLGGFDDDRPADWEAKTLHEFGHALGFMHEHQNPEVECGWRLKDDAGYKRMTDGAGWFTVDRQNRKPGVFTYFGGYANFWQPSKIRRNLLALSDSSAFDRTEFDGESIMKYAMPAFLFVGEKKSPCYLERARAELSDDDVTGARAAYPHDESPAAELRTRQTKILELIAGQRELSSQLRASAERRLEILKVTPF